MCWRWKRGRERHRVKWFALVTKIGEWWRLERTLPLRMLPDPAWKSILETNNLEEQRKGWQKKFKWNKGQHAQSPYIRKPRYSQQLLLGEICPRKSMWLECETAQRWSPLALTVCLHSVSRRDAQTSFERGSSDTASSKVKLQVGKFSCFLTC